MQANERNDELTITLSGKRDRGEYEREVPRWFYERAVQYLIQRRHEYDRADALATGLVYGICVGAVWIVAYHVLSLLHAAGKI